MTDIFTKPGVEVSEELKEMAKAIEQLEQQVIVHCHIKASMDVNIRIWQTTFLLDHASSHKSQLLHNENIPLVPAWKKIPSHVEYVFTLFFSGLPKSCKKFHLFEVIPESGGFEALNIIRNDSDVYHVNL